MSVGVVWFRRDLRLADNPALLRALDTHDEIVPVFIHAPEEEAPWEPGAASRWWLHHSLASLGADLAELGSRLIIRRGGSLASLMGVIEDTGAEAVYWNRLYDPALVRRDMKIKQELQAASVQARSSNAALLNEPWTVTTGAGKPYRVFTPYWRSCRARLGDPAIAPAPEAMPRVRKSVGGDSLEHLELLPEIAWDSGLAASWKPGERGAWAQVQAFLDGHLEAYGQAREFPARPGTSRLSPHLHFGEIGPRQLVAAAHAEVRANADKEPAAEKYLSEIGWREFAHHLLFHFPETIEQPLNPKFAGFPWRSDGDADYRRWCRGRTGIPIVDAAMRELWTRGWMHNRMRMVVGSLLTKNLQMSWSLGARWFWDTLVDADLASNTLGWQWISGCGADAAPYYRIFNPLRQSENYDSDGEYVRRWVPELAALPDKHLNAPWEAPEEVLREAGVRLGDSYPKPIVDLSASRREALELYKEAMSGA